MAISTSRLTKFLKNRKGEVLMVETASSITMETMDESTVQPLRMALNWVEVGDAASAMIVSEPTDSFFPVSA